MHVHPKLPWVSYINSIPESHTAVLEGKNPAPAPAARETEGVSTPTSPTVSPFEGWPYESAMVKIDGLVHHNFTTTHVAAATGAVEVLKSAIESSAVVTDLAVTHMKFTTTMAAARGGHPELLQLLLNAEPAGKFEKRLRGHDKHGMTPLMHAAAVGDVPAVEFLIKEGAKVDAHDKLNRSVLMHAALSGNGDLVKILVDNGAELKHRQAGTGRPVSMFAAQMGGMAVVRMLNETNSVPIDDRDEHGATVAMLAAKSGNQDLFAFVRAKINLEGLEAIDKDNRDIVFYAAQGGNCVIIESLLKEEPLKKSVSKKDKHGVTPTMLAARSGKVDALETLIRHGGSVLDMDDHHRSVAMYASESGNGDVMKVLLTSGVKVGHFGKHKVTGSTVAMYAAQSNSHDLLDLLAEHGASLTDKDDQHLTVAMHAANSGSVEVMKMFLQKGITLEGLDNTKRTVAMHAVHSGSVPLLNLLVENKVTLKGVDKYGWNLPITAARTGNCKMLDAVVAAMTTGDNAEKESELLQVDDLEGRNILSHAAEAGSVNAVRTLISKKVPLFEFDKHGRCHVSHAAEHGRTSAVRLLLANGTPVDKAESNNLYLPIHYAAAHGCKETVEILLDAKASSVSPLEAKTKEGKTILMLAAESGSADLIEFLLERGASKSAVDSHGKNAKAYAEGHTCRACIALLQ